MRQIYVTLLGESNCCVRRLKDKGKIRIVLYVQKYWGFGLWSGFIYRQSPPQQKISNKKGEEKIGKPVCVCVCVWKNKQEKEKRGGNG